MVFRKPRVTDVAAIKKMIDTAAEGDAVLPRTVVELCECVRDFHVYEDDQGMGACCALHVDMTNLAEIRSLVVRPDLQGKGLGKRILSACMDEARELGIARVYALTRSPGFFASSGFHEIDKHELPSKVFRDCVRCTKFPDCDEIAMVFDLEDASTARE